MLLFAALGFGYINLALNQPAVQQSTYETLVASLAVDGDNYTTSCTKYHVYPWWSVDLGAPYDVHHVTVTHDRDPNHGTVAELNVLIYDRYSELLAISAT